MKITVVAHLAPPSHCAGAEMMLLSMLRPLVERGHEVQWLLSRPTLNTSAYDLHGIIVHPSGTYDLVNQIRASDLAVTHLENTPILVTLARAYDVPFIIVKHNDHDSSRAWAVDDAAALVMNSQWLADAYGNPANSIIVRPPVIPSDYLTNPGTKVTLINLNENKGGNILAALAQRMPDVAFLGIIGAYGDQIIPDLPNVEIRPHTSDMRTVYGDTRILLMPSRYESWGRTAVEAMWSGIPVIASPTPGLVEALGPAGTFCDRDNLSSWVFEIRRLMRGEHWCAASRLAAARALDLDMAGDVTRWTNFIEQAPLPPQLVGSAA